MNPVERVRQALVQASHEDTITEFPAGAHSAADAAAVVGCTIDHIAKSIIFRANEQVVLVVASGSNRIDRKKVAAVLGYTAKVVGPDWVTAQTGFPVGGVSPIGHIGSVTTIIDVDLLQHGEIWAAAGSPLHVFRTTPDRLVSMTGGRVAEVSQD